MGGGGDTWTIYEMIVGTRRQRRGGVRFPMFCATQAGFVGEGGAQEGRVVAERRHRGRVL